MLNLFHPADDDRLAARASLAFAAEPRWANVPAWIEPLVAESLGKAGTPFDIEVVDDAAGHHARVAGLGALIDRWEVATAMAGIVLGVQPFDQPDVEAAKRVARSMMAGDAAALTALGRPPLVGRVGGA